MKGAWGGCRFQATSSSSTSRQALLEQAQRRRSRCGTIAAQGGGRAAAQGGPPVAQRNSHFWQEDLVHSATLAACKCLQAQPRLTQSPLTGHGCGRGSRQRNSSIGTPTAVGFARQPLRATSAAGTWSLCLQRLPAAPGPLLTASLCHCDVKHTPIEAAARSSPHARPAAACCRLGSCRRLGRMPPSTTA